MNDVNSLLQLAASSPEGPATPVALRAADLIMEASIDSNSTGCTSGGSSLQSKIQGEQADWKDVDQDILHCSVSVNTVTHLGL